jgi:hypothetical protein
MLNETIWNSLRSDQPFRQAVPAWAQFLLEMSFAGLQGLPLSADSPDSKAIFRPTLRTFQVTLSYLDFLRRQIRSETRGKKWSELLQSRLDALFPYEGKELHEVIISRRTRDGYDLCWMALEPESNRLVRVEQ